MNSTAAGLSPRDQTVLLAQQPLPALGILHVRFDAEVEPAAPREH